MPTNTASPAAPASASGPRTAGFVAVVGALAMLPAIASDMYLPALPDVVTDLGTTSTAVQWTITGVVIGGGVGQLIFGPLSDRFGRRRPAVYALAAHLLLSLVCAVAPTVGVLISARVIQGVSAAGATVVAMAVIRDRFVGAEAARLMSRLMLVVAAAPLLAPTVGGAVAAQWGWRGVFIALALAAAAILVVTLTRLPETLPPERRRSQGAVDLARGYLTLARDGRFMSLGVIPGLGMGVVIAYVSASSFVLQEHYGLSGMQFAMAFAVGGLGLVTGTQVNGSLVRRIGPARLLGFGAPGAAATAVLMLVVASTGWGGVAGLMATVGMTLAFLGFVMPNASALAISRHGERAGTAAATMGFFQQAMAGLIGSLVGLLGSDAVAMATVILASATSAVLVLALATPAYRRGGWIALEDVGS